MIIITAGYVLIWYMGVTESDPQVEASVLINIRNRVNCESTPLPLRAVIPLPSETVCVQPPYMQQVDFETEIARPAPGYKPNSDGAFVWWLFDDQRFIGAVNLRNAKLFEITSNRESRCNSISKSTITFGCPDESARYFIKEH